MLLDIAIFITLLVIAIRVCKAISGQSMIFNEFKQSKTLAYLVFLYPAGPLIKIFGATFLPIILVFGLAASCYIPALIIANQQNAVFQSAGTDRVREAEEAVTSVVSGSIIGLIYLSVVIVLTYAFSSYTGG